MKNTMSFAANLNFIGSIASDIYKIAVYFYHPSTLSSLKASSETADTVGVNCSKLKAQAAGFHLQFANEFLRHKKLGCI